MNTDRDRFLTEAMGKCWHELDEKPDPLGYALVPACKKCERWYPQNSDFSTWPGFGVLKEWAEKQNWWRDFITHICEVWPNDQWSYNSYWKFEEINKPDRFANALYEFLKEAK